VKGEPGAATSCAGSARSRSSYNQVVRISAVLLLILSLAACNRGNQSNEAVRLGVVDYLTTKAQLNVAAMDITVTSVQYKGNQADATISIRPKGGPPEQAMSMAYKLEQQGQKWVVTGRNESGAQHGAGAMPPAAAPNPHGGDPAASGAGKMPSPEDLPPAGKKKE
jgi:hypothetical protein